MITQYALWAGFLLLQNASFTFVSRARNSASYGLHIIAAICSNGVWMMAQFVSLGIIIDLIKTGTFSDRAFAVTFYTTFTVIGSVTMHWFGKTYIEKGKRKVGA
jgi:hypothetical protein